VRTNLVVQNPHWSEFIPESMNPEKVQTDVDRKKKIQLTPVRPKVRDPIERSKDFNIICEGFDLAQAQYEAYRCIQCPAAPCVKACPLHNDIPKALAELASSSIDKAARIFRNTNPIPEMCGRLCPQERLCEGACVLRKLNKTVAIGWLEAFLGENSLDMDTKYTAATIAPNKHFHVAIAGAGPAGLTAAEILIDSGIFVTVFDVWPKPGGILRYGIPSFKLSKAVVDTYVNKLTNKGVRFESNKGFLELVSDWPNTPYDALLLTIGASRPRSLGITGENIPQIVDATEFLINLNLPQNDIPVAKFDRTSLEGKNLLIIGGGDTAIDCARSAIRAGAAEVICAYRRGQEHMRARRVEVQYAEEEGVKFLFNYVPVAFSTNGTKVEAKFTVDPQGSQLVSIECDYVVKAIGYEVDKAIFEKFPLLASQSGTISANNGRTNYERIYAAGDCVRGADLVVTAVADGKKAAFAIINDLIGTVQNQLR